MKMRAIFFVICLTSFSCPGKEEIPKILSTISDAGKVQCYDQSELGLGVAALDRSCISARVIASQLIEDFPKKLPIIKLSAIEKANENSNQIKIQNIISNLLKKYPNDLSESGFGWHGRSSLQRMIWQNPEVQTLIKDPLLLRLLLKNAQENSDPFLVHNNTLASFILFGLANNFPSYLMLSTPNWKSAPDVDGVSWKLLDDMNVKPAKEVPQIPTILDIQNYEHLCQSFQKTLIEVSNPNTGLVKRLTGLTETLDKASPAELYQRLITILKNLKPEQVSLLVGGAAGKSTELPRMNGQTLEVMSEFPKLVEVHKNDKSKVLQYGLVSHALDTNHLIASIYGIQKDIWQYRKVKTRDSQNALKGLLDEFASGTLDEKTTVLLRARLHQALENIYQKSSQVDIDPKSVINF